MLHRMIRMDRTQVVITLLLVVFGVFMVLPLLFIFNNAFKPRSELFIFPPTLFVREPTWANFAALSRITEDSIVPFSRYLFNSIAVSVSGTLAVLLISALCAYALSKHSFPGRNLLFAAIILSLMFVQEAVQIPTYILVSELGMMNSYWAHLLPHIASPVGVFLMKQFIDQIPNELIEAGKIDGAREFSIIMRIVLPVAMPAVATSAILQFQTIWGDPNTSILFMQDDTMKTLPYFMSTLISASANSVARQGAAAAAVLILFVPTLLIFLVFQRKVIATMAHSGLK
ncbi:ABC transporter permease [Paenibacillus nasutitermitis]|uniref:ABC transporter permease n=1 Tax=Paenibacillus nasutitermitis TaxID=1652958 RepID=A0A916Z715_9BACL|nr:carbohydrate ABC transporter permease [Paenibacillus nasutitermitis]GGD79827.1 ABC transporter permease [Paenibacillus nasutitermitis]